MMLTRLLAMSLVAAAGAAAADSPTPKDFAYGLSVESGVGPPAHEFTLPDEVYQGVTRDDLGDLRVFNAGGIVVPHALCSGPETTAESVSEQPLPVFPLQRARQMPQGVSQSARVQVQTPGGTSVQVIEAPGASAALTPGTPSRSDEFVLDASATQGPLRALRLSWSTPDGASEAQVRVEASEDLNAWRTIVAGATLLHVAADGQALDRNHIDLPEARYRYLRLVRDAGPAVAISGAGADVVQPGTTSAPRWFAAMPAADEDGAFLFDGAHRAPVHEARVVLATANMALRVALDSRSGPDQPWRERWSGEISSVDGGNAAQTPPFPAVTDSLWRMRVLRGAESLGGGRPTLRLGYHPARLRFLAQGDGPFVVGYGSARVAPAETASCAGLLPNLPAREQIGLIGAATATPAPAGSFGGPDMLSPPPKPTPVRQIVLWAVLLIGAAALVGMALSLLRRLREGGSA